MAVSSFNVVASQSSATDKATLVMAAQNVWYKLSGSFAAGGYSFTRNTSANLYIWFVSSNRVVTRQDNITNTSFSISIAEACDTILFMSDGGAHSVSLQFAGISGGNSSNVFELQTITSSQSVTLSSDCIVMAIGGGGNGGNGASSNYFYAGGGGSGYLARGIVSAGTYNAIIAGPTGTTTFANLSASGGSSGQNTGYDSSAGGAGGSGGAAGDSPSGGFNGNAGGNSGNNADRRGGTGSSVVLKTGIYNAFSNLESVGTTARGQGGGLYAGGAGGSFTQNRADGQSANGFGGGGGGAGGSGFIQGASPANGGSGGNGAIWILRPKS